MVSDCNIDELDIKDINKIGFTLANFYLLDEWFQKDIDWD
jgi:hypothetical protein